jgi:peptide/nickel transport system permease protein
MEFVTRRRNRLQRFLDRMPVLGEVLSRPLGALGFIIVLGFVITVIFAPLLAPYGYADQDIPNRLQGPSRQYLLGTDRIGRDILSRLIYGSRIALGVALPAMGIALSGGLVFGLLAGYLGGFADDVVLVFLDTFRSIPVLMLALVFLVLLGPSLINLVLVIGLSWSPGYARIVRAQVLAAKQNAYVEAERSLGASPWRIAQRHILPNILPPLLIMAAMDLPWVIIFEAGLSFLGLGVRPPTPSWGAILADGYEKIRQTPWPITWAGLTLILTTLGFTLLGETLRDVLDPRLAGTRDGS